MNFHNSWPYEKVMDDIYLGNCPYCGQSDQLLAMKKGDIERAREEIKTLAIMPCCHARMTILMMDDDYLWTNENLRKR